jgi:hypothetical protein
LDGNPCSDESHCTPGDACQGGVCQAGSLLTPWINEFDYDDVFYGGVQDSDEFVEIAAAAGTDLSGYKILAIEGNSDILGGPCFTGFGAITGNAHFTAVIPPGTIVSDDTGEGIGFYVACFTYTSSLIDDAGKCDDILPAPAPDSNLKNGHLTNANVWQCPDGILVLDAEDNLVDAISYEGQIPDAGLYGSYFQVAPYSAGQDQGFKTGVSFEKINNNLARAESAQEWQLTGDCVTAGPFDFTCVEHTNTPGTLNSGQFLTCSELFCGDGIVLGDEQCDEGWNNSDEPDAACRTDCTLRRCGDGILDPNFAPGFAEECEEDADCAPGEICFACACESGTALGPVDFSVVPGTNQTNPPDDGEGTLLRVTEALTITNGSQGDFSPGPLKLDAGVPDGDGIARLILAESVVLGASLPTLAGAGRVCYRLRQDPDHRGFVDCDGGSNTDVELSLDSHGADPDGPSTFTIPADVTDSGAGAVVVRVLLEAAATSDAVTPCEEAEFSVPIRTAFTTSTATSVILNAQLLGGGTGTIVGAMAGQPFDCSNWTENAGASIVVPNLNTDVELPLGLGTMDLTQLLRLNDD